MGKKLFIVAIIGAGLYYAITFLMSWHSGVEHDLYGQAEVRGEKTLANADPNYNGKNPPSSAPRPTAPVGSPTTGGGLTPGRVLITTRPIDAYATSNSTKVMGRFLKGSTLTIVGPDKSGKTKVAYRQKDNTILTVLCNGDDIK